MVKNSAFVYSGPNQRLSNQTILKEEIFSVFLEFQGLQSVKLYKQPREVFYKKGCSWKFRNIHKKTPVMESIFYRCFPVITAKFLIAPILKNICELLLPYMESSFIQDKSYMHLIWSSCLGVSYRIVVLKKIANFRRNQTWKCRFLVKFQIFNLTEKGRHCRLFLVSYAKVFKTVFLSSTSSRLLLPYGMKWLTLS